MEDKTNEQMIEPMSKQTEELVLDDIDELIDENEEDQAKVQEPKKHAKKHFFQPCVIVTLCAFVVTVLFFASWYIFFQRSIVGSWGVDFTYTSSDDETYTYSLNFDFKSMDSTEETNTGDVTITLGNVSYFGTYVLQTSDDGEPQLWIYATMNGSSVINSHLLYSVEGNRLTGLTLKMTDVEGSFIPSGDDMDFEMNPSVVEYEIAPTEDAVADENVVGTWSSDDSIYNYVFNDDQTFEIFSQYHFITGSYSAEDSVLIMHYYNTIGEVVEYELSYELVDEDTISLNDAEYTRSGD